jgi:hypothetical protein
MTEQKGPREITIPEIRFQVCNGCLNFEQRLMRSGRNPQYQYICHFHFTNENINDKMPSYITNDLKSSNKVGVGIYSDYNDGYCHTPDWCPIINEKTSLCYRQNQNTK